MSEHSIDEDDLYELVRGNTSVIIPYEIPASAELHEEINSLDNENTIKYKYSVHGEASLKEIYLVIPPSQNIKYIDHLKSIVAIYVVDAIVYYVRENLDDGDKITDVLYLISDKFPGLTVRDLFFFLYDQHLSDEQTGDDIFESVSDKQLTEWGIYILKKSKILTSEVTKDMTDDAKSRRLTDEYKKWESDIVIRRENDADRGKSIMKNQKELLESDVDPLVGGDIELDKVTQIANIRISYKNKGSRSKDWMDVFVESNVSTSIPYIKYKSKDHSYYKLFNGDMNTDYDLIVPTESSTENNNSMYLTVLTHKSEQNKINQKSYETTVIDTLKGRITYTRDPNLIDFVKVIQDELGLIVNDEHDIKVSGSFVIYEVEYIEILFYMSITTDEILSTYLYVDESINAYPFKQRINYHYRDSQNADSESTKSSVKFTMTPGITTSDILDDSLSHEIVKGTPYVIIKVDRAPNREVLRHFREVMLIILTRYSFGENPLIHENYQMAEYLLGDQYDMIIQEHEAKKGKKKIMTSLNIQPGELTPDYPWEELDRLQLIRERTNNSEFSNPKYKYSRSVGKKKNYPLVLTKEEVPSWKKTQYTAKGITYDRVVLEYPPGSKDPWYFVCPDDDLATIGLSFSKNMSNVTIDGVTKKYSEWFPTVPKCYKSGAGTEKKIRAYMEGGDISVFETGKKKGTHKSTTTQLCLSGIAKIPPEFSMMEKILESVNPNYIYERSGTFQSPNSLIHSIIKAVTIGGNFNKFQINESINLKDYDLADNDTKESMVQKMRLELVSEGYINPSLLRQEMYDMTESEIESNLQNYESFFDTKKYYRVLEELFNINIYVFTTGSNKESSIGLEIANYREFHSRINRTDRSTAIIFKNYGPESKKLPYPHCELIFATERSHFSDKVSKQRTKSNVYQNYLFDAKMGSALYGILMMTSVSYTWNVPEWTNEPVARTNIYSKADYEGIFSGTGLPLGQIIDSYGKLRGLVYDFSKGTNNNDNLVVMTNPSQPGNYPSISWDDPMLRNVPSLKTIQKLFSGNTITGYTQRVLRVTQQNFFQRNQIEEVMIDGIWFELNDIEYGVHVPFQPIPIHEFEKIIGSTEIKSGPPNPIRKDLGGVVERIKKLRKTLDTIMQIIVWAFSVWFQKKNSDYVDADEFVSEYFVINETSREQINDSSLIYQEIRRIPRILPNFKEVSEVMGYVNEYITGLIVNDNEKLKFGLYSEKFYRGLRYFIRQYYHVNEGFTQVKMGRKKVVTERMIRPPTEITRYYEVASDFPEKANTAIFLKGEEMRSWIRTIKRSEQGFIQIQNHLDIGFGNLSDPYIYSSQSEDKNIYMMQNVLGGDRSRAIQVALDWHIKRINRGFDSSKYLGDTYPPYYVYSISNDKQAFAEIDLSGGQSEFLQILSYGNNTFSAMLPIL